MAKFQIKILVKSMLASQINIAIYQILEVIIETKNNM